MIFPYGEKQIKYLCSRDERLGAVIRRVGVIEREVDTDIFASIVKNIAGQQISNAALKTVLGRLYAASGEMITPDSILTLGVGGIRACGMSMKKAENIFAAAEATKSGALDIDGLATLSDNEVIERLTALRGVGVWTAEMILIFSLCRENVLSFGDFGIRRGIEMLYGESKLTRARLAQYRERYSPYATVASFYLWKIGNGEVDIQTL